MEKIINELIDHHATETGMDRALVDEVKRELRRRYGATGTSANGSTGNTSKQLPSEMTAVAEQKARQIWAKKGVTNPTPQQIKAGIESIQRQMGQ